MDHWRFFRERLLQLIPVLFGISLIVFLLLRLIPGDPALIMLGTHATDDQIANLHAAMGLDRPLWQQYLIFVENAVTGNLGISLFAHRPVLQIISEKMPITLTLVAYASVLALLLTLPVAFAAALRRESLLDYGIRGVLILGLAMPSFWLGLILLLLFAVDWHLFPIAGVGNDPASQLWHLFLPALTLSLPMAAMLIRNLRSTVIDVLKTPYVEFARAKGLGSATVIRKHVLPNSLISVITVLGLNIGWLVGGSVVVETVFSIPGMGNLAVTSVFARDYPMVQGITLVFGVSVIIVNLLTDYTYALLDPRVTYE
jgi:peptide/nickel transport system permease protein